MVGEAQPLRIVVAHNRYVSTQPSGENRIVDLEIEQLRDAGLDVVPFVHSSDEIASFPITRKALLPFSLTYARTAQAELGRLIEQYRPHVVHLHNPYPLLSPWVVRTAHQHGVPVVHTVHNYRQVCASGVYFRDGHTCTECSGRAVGWPAIRHGCYRGSRLQSVAMTTALTAHRGTWRSVDRYIALTPGVADHLGRYGIPEERIVVKPNAIPGAAVPAPVGDGFLFMGRLSPEKGVDLVLEAWARRPVGSLGTLRIAGTGERASAVERAAAARPDIDYLGQLDLDGVGAAVAASAVVLVTSQWDDVLPTSAIEALAAGRPVLGTDMGGIPYIVGADPRALPSERAPGRAGVVVGTAGWVVPPRPDALSEALPLAAAGAATMAAGARQRYDELFSPAVVTGRLVEVYEDLARTR